jgi:hypothetical protein
MAGKVTKLHQSGDLAALMIMHEEDNGQIVFADYLIVSRHIGEALMGQPDVR